MITDEMLRNAAARSCEIYVNLFERGYDPESQHVFSVGFEKKIKKLKRRADHPVFYRALQRIASVILAILIGGGAWLTVNVEARAAVVGWIKEIYETFFVYRFSDDVDISTEAGSYEPTWLPDGYLRSRESDTGGRISIVYKNETGQLLRFHYIYEPSETNAFVDAGGGAIKTVIVGDYEADIVLFDDPGIANNILWTDRNNCAFYISAFLSEDELIKIATSVYEK